MAEGIVFLNDTATTEIYTLSLHDALPISSSEIRMFASRLRRSMRMRSPVRTSARPPPAAASGDALRMDGEPEVPRSEEHTSELQSRQYLVCRLLLEKKKNT